MEMLGIRGAFAEFIAKSLKDEDFVLVDVGCGGGIDSTWRVFADRLSAVGFDAQIEEVRRLTAAETSEKISYRAAFVGTPPEHPISTVRGTRPPNTRDPQHRFAFRRTMNNLADRIKNFSSDEIVEFNVWKEADLPQPDRIFLPEYLDQIGFSSIDFVKIDIDSDDFDVLQSLETSLNERGVLGLCLEVNFYGSDNPTEHVFHNTDRFMRKNGFDLFGLTTRNYSAAALPRRYALDRLPAQSIGGRPYQGDALYLRDAGSPEWSNFGQATNAEKLLKLAALFSLFGLPDWAADILIEHHAHLKHVIDISRGLDLLASETEIGTLHSMDYAALMTAFQADDDIFYPTPSEPDACIPDTDALDSIPDTNTLDTSQEQVHSETLRQKIARMTRGLITK